MVEIPRKEVEELLKRVGFLEEEIEKVNLISAVPVPVVEIWSHNTKEIQNMWGEILDGRESQIKEVVQTFYQCILRGKVLVAKKYVRKPNSNGSWDKNSLQIVAFIKFGDDKLFDDEDIHWIEMPIFKDEEEFIRSIKNNYVCRNLAGPHRAKSEVDKVAKFVELLTKWQSRGVK